MTYSTTNVPIWTQTGNVVAHGGVSKFVILMLENVLETFLMCGWIQICFKAHSDGLTCAVSS